MRHHAADDRVHSPYTGYTRAHWEQLADHLLLSLRPYASPSHALINLPGPVSSSGRRSDGLEGFARSFLLAAFRLAGADGDEPHGLADWYASGLATGVDPSSKERWLRPDERHQSWVEAASLVIALHETRPWLWDRLDDSVRERIVEWLSPMVGRRCPSPNNWVWFQNCAQAFLRTVGGPYRADEIEHNLELHESWYVGDGWYTDGGDRHAQHFDYYGAWAMHLYPLWYHRILGERPNPAYVERLRSFLADHARLVAPDGAPLFQGRSLTYRFAMLVPFFTGTLFDATPLEPGVTRRICNGVLKHFVDHGAVGDTGLLSIGWHRGFATMRQRYSGAGSPYWASKAFAGLLLRPDHPVWTAEEQPMPAEGSDQLAAIPRLGWVVSSTTADGIIRVVNHGAGHITDDRAAGPDNPFYRRHAYTSHTAPDLDQAAHRDPIDSHVALVNAHGRYSHRGRIDRLGRPAPDTNVAVSRGRALWIADLDDDPGVAIWPVFKRGPWITTASVLRGAVEVRLARITLDAEPDRELDGDPDEHWNADDGPWHLHIGGHTIAADTTRPRSDTRQGRATATRADGLTSIVHNLLGASDSGTTYRENANPFGKHGNTPWLCTPVPAEPGRIYAAAVILANDGSDHVDDIKTFDADHSTGKATIHWRSGPVDTVDLSSPT